MNVPGKAQLPQKSISDMMTRTEGTVVGGSFKFVGGFDGLAGSAYSKTDDNKIKSCKLVSFCPSIGAVAQATGNVQKLYSAGEMNSGISISTCATGVAGATVGGTASNCTTIFDSSGIKQNFGFKTPKELYSLSNQTVTVGGVAGAAVGVSGSICPQITICSVPK